MTSARVAQYAADLIPPAALVSPDKDLLLNCDASMNGLAAAFKWELLDKLDAAWIAACTGAVDARGSTQFAGHIVQDVHTHELDGDWGDVAPNWPALFLWRLEEEWTQQTMGHDSSAAVIQVAYVLPPLTHEFVDRLGHVRRAVVNTLRSFIERQTDPGYNSATNWLTSLSIQSLRLVRAEYRVATETKTQQDHRMVLIRLELKERSEVNNAGLEDFTSVDSTVETSDDPALVVTESIVNPYTP